jgi:hypothetical protein
VSEVEADRDRIEAIRRSLERQLTQLENAGKSGKAGTGTSTSPPPGSTPQPAPPTNEPLKAPRTTRPTLDPSQSGAGWR